MRSWLAWLAWCAVLAPLGAEARSSGTVAVDGGSGEVWVADADAGQVAVLAPGGAALRRRITLGGAPSEIVVGDDGTAYVTLRGSGEVAVVARGARAPRLRVAVGREPFALALPPSRAFVLVTLAGEAALVGLDPETLAELFRVPLGREPRGVAVLADGSAAVVAHLTEAAVSVVELPARERGPAPPRLRERLTLSPGAGRLANLALAVVADPTLARVYVPHAVKDPGGGDWAEPPVYGAGAPLPVAFEVSTVAVDKSMTFGDTELFPGRRFGRGNPTCYEKLSQPRAALLDGAGRLFVAGLGSDTLTALDVRPEPGGQRLCVRLPRGSGADGLALSPDGGTLYVHLAFRHALASVRLPSPDAETRPARVSVVSVAPETLSPSLQRGRALFYGAGNRRQSAEGRLPCATCHPDGAHDGVVWHLGGEGPRQTPVLAGRLARSGPYNWRGSGATLRENLVQTVTRLGGSGLDAGELDDLERFLRTRLTRAPRRADPLPALVARGRALFTSDELGCAGCHDPRRGWSDGKVHNVGSQSRRDVCGNQFATPSLVGLAASAPYLHDGSAPDLRALVAQWNADDRMGQTSHLATADLDALLAYLASL